MRVNIGGSVAGFVSNWKVISPGTVTCPVGGSTRNYITDHSQAHFCIFFFIQAVITLQVERNTN